MAATIWSTYYKHMHKWKQIPIHHDNSETRVSSTHHSEITPSHRFLPQLFVAWWYTVPKLLIYKNSPLYNLEIFRAMLHIPSHVKQLHVICSSRKNNCQQFLLCTEIDLHNACICSSAWTKQLSLSVKWEWVTDLLGQQFSHAQKCSTCQRPRGKSSKENKADTALK